MSDRGVLLSIALATAVLGTASAFRIGQLITLVFAGILGVTLLGVAIWQVTDCVQGRRAARAYYRRHPPASPRQRLDQREHQELVPPRQELVRVTSTRQEEVAS